MLHESLNDMLHNIGSAVLRAAHRISANLPMHSPSTLTRPSLPCAAMGRHRRNRRGAAAFSGHRWQVRSPAPTRACISVLHRLASNVHSCVLKEYCNSNVGPGVTADI